MSNSWTNQEETLLAEYLSSRITNQAAGRLEDECLRNYPRDVYFIGNLRPREESNHPETSFQTEMSNKLSPVAYGAEFSVCSSSELIDILVKAKWSCYYRVFPTLDQQRALSFGMLNAEASEEIEDPNTDSERTYNGDHNPETNSTNPRRRVARDPLFVKFRKIRCEAEGVISFLQRDGSWMPDTTNLQHALVTEIRRSVGIALADPDRIRTQGPVDEHIRIPDTMLTAEDTYRRFLSNLQTEIVPEWRWEVETSLRHDYDDRYSIFISLINSTQFDKTINNQINPNVEPFLFDVSLCISVETGKLIPFNLELTPRGFRFNSHLWGRGFNCTVEKDSQKDNFIKTNNTPTHYQMRYTTRSYPTANFSDLATDPIPYLEQILGAMRDYKNIWSNRAAEYAQTIRDWEDKHKSEFERDLKNYEDEIARFSRGLELIRDNKDIQLSFRLTNKTFQEVGNHPRPEKRKYGWRLFQIVFLVSQISGIVADYTEHPLDIQERQFVDIIYFPTGGGKTEAYLGVIVFNCFFDRLRGKNGGVTAWTRFPLRLLTLQQTQRMADVIGIAELVRRNSVDSRLVGAHIDPFAVGYFVGSEATPNEITNNRNNQNGLDVSWIIANDPVHRQKWKRVIYCPSCRTKSVQVDFDPGVIKVIHRCTNQECAFTNGIIPIYVVDNEIYRYLPSVIVGTIDKLASIGNQRKMALIFGKVDGRCPTHGYYKGKCCQKGCNIKLRRITHNVSGPTLFVQDELHLLKEGLGTFDSHYETFVRELQREFGQKVPAKILASSATIEQFDRQVEHLYGCKKSQARIFPGIGPTLTESFYATTLNYPQRLFIGILPHNKTIFNTILELIEIFHREVQRLYNLGDKDGNPYGGVLVPGTSEYRSLLDFYSSSLTYFLATRELDAITTDLDGDTNPNLQRDGLEPLNIFSLTGSTSTDDVTGILERLEQTRNEVSTDTVLATNMISHGVDIDRFNFMVFYGMPRQNAEYIQASSRVGRSHVGIVINCLHPARERDQSHYSYFEKFHEFLGQLVEPVAINRWAKFSIDRTLPGLFMAVLLQIKANSSQENPNLYYMVQHLQRKFSEGSLRAEDILPVLEAAYLSGIENPNIRAACEEQIRIKVRQFIDWIIQPSITSTFVSDVLLPRPMTSLRDVDEQISIELDSLGTDWVDSFTRR